MSAKTEQINLRMDAELVQQVDDFARQENERLPGLGLNRSAAIRILVTRGLKTLKDRTK